MIEGMTMGIFLMLSLGAISGLAIWKRDKIRNPQEDCSTCTNNRHKGADSDTCTTCTFNSGHLSNYQRGFGIR